MHTAHSICHTIGSRTCSHVIRVKCTSCTTAGSNGEVLLACLEAFLLVCTCNRVLESCRVGGVTCDGDVNVLLPEDSNTFLNIVCTIAVDLSSRRIRILGVACSGELLELACLVVILSLNICEAVDSGDDLSSVLSETVKDNSKRLLTNTVSLLSDTDSALSCCE